MLDLRQETGKAECGLICISMLAHLLGIDVPIESLRKLKITSSRGLSLGCLLQAFEMVGMETRAAWAEHNELARLPMPYITHLRSNHFVVVVAFFENKVDIFDPRDGRQMIDLSWFYRVCTQYVIHAWPSPDARTSVSDKPLNYSYDHIVECKNLIRRQMEDWEYIFDLTKTNVVRVTYEQWLRDKEAVIVNVAAIVTGSETMKRLAIPRTSIQRDNISRDWNRRLQKKAE